MSILKSFSFELPTRIEYGLEVLKQLPNELKSLNAKQVVIVTDKGVIKAGLLENIKQILYTNGFNFEVFDKVEPNPKDYNVHEGMEKSLACKADVLVAVGGGSVIDCAKGMAILVTHGGHIKDYEGYGKISKEVLPIIAIPTTAGSGSEVTFSSVITDSKMNYKFGIKNPKIAAKVALIDPQMTVTMPPPLTAATGMDALTHAIEGYTALAAEPLADAAALYAIELISKNLRIAVYNGNNLEARGAMALGNVLGGIAFSHSDVASVHCIAEALGGKYDAAHGVCNAIVLPEIMRFNMEYCSEKYARIALAMGLDFNCVKKGAEKAVEAVENLAQDIKLPLFRSLGVKEEDLEELARLSAMNMSNEDNPRPMGQGEYLEVLRKMYERS